MDDSNQIEVPSSFLDLYTIPGAHRLTEPMAEIRRRYELCEDMAQMLMEQAERVFFASGGSKRNVLDKFEAALSAPESAMKSSETQWVVTRLAELLGWSDA